MGQSIEDNQYTVKLQQRIDWADLDMFGHVNNVMFMKYVQASRVNYWEQIGLYQHFLKTNFGPMLVAVSCQFRKPLHYPGSLIVYSRMKYIKNTSFSIQHLIVDDQGDVSAEAEDVIVMYDFNRNEKMPFPAEFRERVEKLEGRAFN